MNLQRLLEKQRQALKVYMDGSERLQARDVEQFLLGIHINLCHLIRLVDGGAATDSHLRKRIKIYEDALDEIASTFPGSPAARMAETAINWKEIPDERHLPPRAAE